MKQGPGSRSLGETLRRLGEANWRVWSGGPSLKSLGAFAGSGRNGATNHQRFEGSHGSPIWTHTHETLELDLVSGPSPDLSSNSEQPYLAGANEVTYDECALLIEFKMTAFTGLYHPLCCLVILHVRKGFSRPLAISRIDKGTNSSSKAI